MKKIAYIFEGSLNHRNSVRDILYNLLCQFDPAKYEQIIIPYCGMLTRPFITENIGGYKTYRVLKCPIKELLSNPDLNTVQKISYFTKNLTNELVSRIPRIRYIHRDKEYIRFYDKLLKLEKPDLIVYFTISPQKGFSTLCRKRNIPYISMLYDTYISRPYITQREAAIENEEIVNSAGYFIPDFFMADYSKHYNYPNIHSFRLPLLIPESDVMEAYNNIDQKFKFSYFGQLQAFRNGNRIKELFKMLGERLDIFSSESQPSDDTYVFHEAVSEKQLYKVVASSDFLVAFDNSEPYANYLPSKVYLYVSFTKPIIVFGNNKDSALKRFLKRYPLCYYQNIDNPSLEGLEEFIRSTQHANGFNENIYLQYTDYLPQKALKDIVMIVENTIEKRS